MAGANFRTKNQLLLAKIESESGTDAVPTVGSNAVLVEDPQVSLDLVSIQTNEVGGDLDAVASIPAGGSQRATFATRIHGSGTATTAPEFSPLLRAASFSETTTGSAVTGTAQAGDDNTITLASGASATNDFYLGMRIELDGGTGDGQERLIVGYVGSTKVATVDRDWDTNPDATSTYSIEANVQYRPGAALPTATIYRYHHHANGTASLLDKMLGAAANAVIQLQVREGGTQIQYDVRSQLASSSDESRPSDPTYQSTRPPPWINAPTYLNGTRIAAAELRLDMGASVNLLDDPNELYGVGLAGITERRIQGTLLVPKDTVAEFNLLSFWAAGTVLTISTYWGSVAGNKMALVIPRAIITNAPEQDRQGFSYRRMTFETNATAPRFALTFS